MTRFPEVIAEIADKMREHEPHRHACEVRWVVELSGYQRMIDYFDAVEKARGRESMERLREDVRTALRARKRAQPKGDTREEPQAA